MVRYRKSTIAVNELPEGKFLAGDKVMINGEVMEVTAVNTASATLVLRRLTWLGRLQRRLSPPYRIGVEGSSDRVILRFDLPWPGLYLSTRMAAWRLRVAWGSGYARTFDLYRPPAPTDLDSVD